MSKKQQKIPELDKLFNEVEGYSSNKYIKDLFKFVVRFPHIAPYNAMLVHMQKPGSTFVTTVSQWKRKYHRKPKLGASPLVVLQPFGPVCFVYELNDTEGAPFPEYIEKPFDVIGKIDVRYYQRCIESLQYEGIKVVEQNYGTSLGGYACVINEVQRYYSRKGTAKDFNIHFGIVVNETNSIISKLFIMFHELGHIFCGHLKQEKSYIKYRKNLSDEVCEWEAQSVAWLVSERLGINDKGKSAEYLNSYLENDKIPKISAERILNATKKIEDIFIKGVKKPNDKLIIKQK